MNNPNDLHLTDNNSFEKLVERQHKLIKKLDEIKVKVADLKVAKRELLLLTKNIENEILQGVALLEIESDDE